MPAITERADSLILHVSTTIARGGAENHLADLIEHQVPHWRVACAALKGDLYWQPRFSALGVETYPLSARSNFDLRAIRALARLIDRLVPDLVHVHGSPAEIATLVALGIARHRPKLVISRHEERDRLFERAGFRIVDRLLGRAADHIIAISDAVRRVDVERLPAVAGKTSVVHYGLDTPGAPGQHHAAAAAIREQWGVAPDAVLVGTLGRLASEKSLNTLIRAYATLIAQPEFADVRLVLVGKGPLEQELHALASTLGIDDRIIWAGFRDDVPVVAESFDIFTLTSVLEGFGLVLLEAMAAGVPIVATRTSAIPEIVIDGETGLLFPPRDDAALATALATLIRDPDLRRRFGTAGHERLRRDFTVPKMIDRISAIYREVLSSPR